MACIDVSADHNAACFASVRAVAHIIDSDDRIQHVLAGWLAAAGLECRSYPCLSAFLDADRDEAPGCIILDARADAIPCPIALGCPTSYHAYDNTVPDATTEAVTSAGGSFGPGIDAVAGTGGITTDASHTPVTGRKSVSVVCATPLHVLVRRTQ